MKKTILFFLLLIISISSISQEIPADKKQYLLEKSYEILEFIYENDNDFVREPLSVSIKKFKDLDYIFIDYFNRSFKFGFFRGLINKF